MKLTVALFLSLELGEVGAPGLAQPRREPPQLLQVQFLQSPQAGPRLTHHLLARVDARKPQRLPVQTGVLGPGGVLVRAPGTRHLAI